MTRPAPTGDPAVVSPFVAPPVAIGCIGRRHSGFGDGRHRLGAEPARLRHHDERRRGRQIPARIQQLVHQIPQRRTHFGLKAIRLCRRRCCEFTEQTPGNLIAVLHDGVVIGSAIFSEDEPRPAPPDVVRAIEAQTWNDGPPHSEKLGSLGSYRVDCLIDGPETLVVGVSLNLADRIIARKNLTTTALVAAALVVTAGLTVWVVGYTLRPLRRVAATAAEVAAMPLAGDDHRIGARVRQQDTDPDNEVGIVGHTLNRLLDNVDSALAHRVDSDLRMRQFLTDASHELRTPLAAIQGYAELTRQDSSALPPTTEYALARIESEARRMALLVDELLLLSRLGEGEDLQNDDVDLADLVINAVNDAAVAAPTTIGSKTCPTNRCGSAGIMPGCTNWSAICSTMPGCTRRPASR